MKHKLRHLVQSDGLRQSALLAVGNVGATGFSAISLIILSRYLGPAAFGGFSVSFSLTQIVAKLGDLGFNLALQRIVAQKYRDDPAAAADAVRYTGKIKLMAVVAAVAAGLLLGPVLARAIFHVSDPALITLGVCLAAVIIGYEYFLSIVQSTAQFVFSIGMNAAQALLKCSMAVVSFFLLPANPVTAIIWYGLAPLAGGAVGLAKTTAYFRSIPRNVKIRNEMGRVARFGAINVIALAIAENVDVLMVNSSLTEYETGLYSAASRVALMIIVVGMSFGTVFNTRVARYRNRADLNRFLKKAMLFALGSVAVIPAATLLAKPLILVTAGAHFLGAVSTLNYLIAASLMAMAIMPYIAVFYAVDYPAYFAVSGVIQTGLLIACNALFIPLLGIEGAGVAKLIARAVVALYTVTVAYKYARRQYEISFPSVNQLRSMVDA